MKTGYMIIALAALGASAALAGEVRGERTLPSGPSDYISDVIAQVSDSSYAEYVRGLEGFGTRHSSQSNRFAVARWIRDMYLGAGVADARLDSFYTSGVGGQNNVVATIPGTVAPQYEIIVGGHYDSQSSNTAVAPGADDNASGTAAAMEMARVLIQAGYAPRATLRFMAYAAEEQGLLGSAAYAQKARDANRQIVLMQNYDMIGYRDQNQTDQDVRLVWYTGSEYETSLDSAMKRIYTTLTPVKTTQYRNQSDSYSFWARGYKTIFNIEQDFSPFYHTPSDISSVLDFAYAGEIVRSGLALLLTVDASIAAVGVPVAELPERWRLDQNFPNPFNPATEIGYEVPVAGYVSLRVYDMLGREVATLEDGERQPGTYTVRWDASGQASGVYIARLSGGPDKATVASQTIRMLLLR